MTLDAESITEELANIAEIFVKNECVLNEKKTSELLDIIEYYKNAESKERELIREGMERKDWQRLVILSDYLSDKAINDKNYQSLYAAAALLSIENFNWDYRENTIRLAVIWYIAQELDTNPKELLDDISSISSAKASEFFGEFINRPAKTKSLSSMGLIVKKDAEKILIVPKPPPWMK